MDLQIDIASLAASIIRFPEDDDRATVGVKHTYW
jgi:hypothetical protein